MSCANLFPAANRQICVLNLIMQISFKLQTSKSDPANLRIARRVIWLLVNWCTRQHESGVDLHLLCDSVDS